MRLTWKDGAATVLTAAVVALYWAYLAGAGLPLVSGPRALAGAVLALGFAGCALGGGDVARASKRMQTVRRTVAGVLGVTVLIAALVTLFTGNTVWLAVMVGATVAIWATTTVFHVFGPGPAGTPRTPDRELVGRR
jgi:hypothetical protein